MPTEYQLHAQDQAVAAMAERVATLAHEVKNPLFGISSNLDMLELRLSTHAPDPVVAQCVQNLRSELRRVLALTHDLLESGMKDTP